MTLVRSVLLVLLFIVPVLAQDANESREQRRERNFAQRDTNKDGRISREEFSGNVDLTRFGGYLMSNQKGDPLCHEHVRLIRPS